MLARDRRFAIRVYISLGLTALSLSIGGCGAPQPPPVLPPLVDIKVEPPEPNRKESTLFSTLKLVSTTPSVRRTDDALININRLYVKESTYRKYPPGWSTIQVSTFSGRGKIEVAADQVIWRFGISSPGLTSSDPVERRAASAPVTLAIEITNVGKVGLTVDWDAVSIVDQAGEAHKVTHKGVKMADRTGVLAPSTIPPGGTLDDFIYPSEYISFQSGSRYTSATWVGRNFIEGMRPGARFKVFFPLKSATGVTEYQFTFEVGEAPKSATAGTGT